MKDKSYLAYHGTDSGSSDNILSSSFNPSIGDQEWIGDGIYFFIKGKSLEPAKQAEEYAVAKAWNNDLKKYDVKEVSVIESIIQNSDDTLDLSKAEGVEFLDYLQSKFIEEIKKRRKNVHQNIDGLLINLARDIGNINIDVVIGDFYIKFAYERINKLNRRTPNCTICAVNNEKLLLSNCLKRKKTIDDYT